MSESRPAVPLGSLDPKLPPPLPKAAPKMWSPREGATPDAKPKRYTATFDEIVQPTPDVRLFRLSLDGFNRIMPFIAGQFIQFLTPMPDPKNPGKTKELIRSYSIASAPEETNFLEFCIKLVPGGAFTPLLWDKKVGDKIDLRGPHGKFIAHEPVDYDTVFIAAGTGIAPFWGMIQHMLSIGVTRNITLVFGVRYEDDLVYEQEFRELAAKHPNFKAVFTLSRPRHPETWTGEKGYVQSHLATNISDPTNTKAFICGLTPMIEASVAELEKVGMTKEQIHYERYD
ncbi:MAG: FAD-dependent oxidoreductase [Planctomycetota bacterium]